MIEYDWKDWTEWFQLQSLDFAKVPSVPGAYVIATSRSISRAIDVDSFGILDIGESADLNRRIYRFCGCAKKHGEEGHMAGWRFAFFRFARHFPLNTLKVRWITAETKAVARVIEGRTMLAYLANHSELPPLNYSFNWDVFKKDGWDVFDTQIGWLETE